MNFSAVRGFNAYAQFNAKIREAVKNRSETAQAEAGEETEEFEDKSRSVYAEPVDTVTISESARKAATALVALQEGSPYTEIRKFIRAEGALRGSFKQDIPGAVMNNAIAGSGITVDDDEVFKLDIDIQSSITVASRNAEKAKAIQNLLNTTPMNINWGLLLTHLPPM